MDLRSRSRGPPFGRGDGAGLFKHSLISGLSQDVISLLHSGSAADMMAGQTDSAWRKRAFVSISSSINHDIDSTKVHCVFSDVLQQRPGLHAAHVAALAGSSGCVER